MSENVSLETDEIREGYSVVARAPALAKLRYLLLDEATSALDTANEALLYGQLAGLSITPVSVSHHQSVLGYHHQVLELTGDGLWALRTAADYRWT